MDFEVEGAKQWYSTTKGRVGMVTLFSKDLFSAVRTLKSCGLVYHDALRSEINRKPTKFLCDIHIHTHTHMYIYMHIYIHIHTYKHRNYWSSEQKSNLNHKNRGMPPQSIPRLGPVF